MANRRNKISIGPERNVWLTFTPTDHSAVSKTFLETNEHEASLNVKHVKKGIDT